MASLTFPRLLATAAVAIRLVAAGSTIGICRDKVCGDCPETLELQPEDEFPSCGHWNMTAIMANHTGFPEWDNGGWAPFLNVGQPEPTCQVIIRTSTSTDVPGCGIPIAAFHHPFCFQLPLQGVFMVQYCCGAGDCMQGPIHPEDRVIHDRHAIAKRESIPKKESSLKCAGWKIFDWIPGHADFDHPGIPPRIMIPKGGVDPSRRKQYEHRGRVTVPVRLQKMNITDFPRKVMWPSFGCPDWRSWRVLRKYTKPSTVTTAVTSRIQGGVGGGGFSVGVSRADSWSLSLAVGGWSVSKKFTIPSVTTQWSCGITDSMTTNINVPPYTSGHMAFTAIHICEIGIYTCEGRQQEPQEICYPYRDNKRMAGVYHLVSGD